MHAFERVPNRDMAVVVAANWSEVMAVATNLAAGAHALATVGSGLVLLVGGLVLWELFTIRGKRRQKRIFDRTRNEMERLRDEAGVITARAQLNAARLKLVVDSTSDGIALFDSNMRLVQWNHPFDRGIGIELKQDMPLDSLLRAQGRAGLFHPVADVEVEITRRVAVLHSGDAAGVMLPGPDGEALTLRGLPITEGGFMLLLSGLETWAPTPAGTDEPAGPEIVISAQIEW
jgi:PAS domain-containing protein